MTVQGNFKHITDSFIERNLGKKVLVLIRTDEKNEHITPKKLKVKCECCDEIKYCWTGFGDKIGAKIKVNVRISIEPYCLDCLIHNDNQILYNVKDKKTNKLLISKLIPLSFYVNEEDVPTIIERRSIKEETISESQWIRARDYQ